MKTLTNEQIKNNKLTAIKNIKKLHKLMLSDFKASDYKGMRDTTLKSLDVLVASQKKDMTLFINRLVKHYFKLNYNLKR